MTPDVDLHYCKHCQRQFLVRLPERFSGDVFLVCPGCEWQHYRHFALGVAVHCDIGRRHDDPTPARGTFGP